MVAPSIVDVPAAMSAESLRQALAAVAPDAFLVDGWVMRRVIRLDRRLTGLGFSVPHRKSYTIDSGRLLAYVDRPELNISATHELPRTVILLSKPTEKDYSECVTSEELLRRYWRLLFHARVHLKADEIGGDLAADGDFVRARIQEIGEIEFAEIRLVLEEEDILFPEASEWELYVEFMAVFLELYYFANQDLGLFFPAIRDWSRIKESIGQNIDHARIFAATRLGDVSVMQQPFVGRHPDDGLSFLSVHRAPLLPSSTRLRKWQGRAVRAAAMGNRVRAAIYWRRAAACVPPSREGALHDAAYQELASLVDSLREVLQLDERQVSEWNVALRPVLDLAVRSIWSAEARLLADLQKAWIEYESGVFRIDWLRWLKSWGRQSWRSPLPRLRDVLLTKHIRSAERRLDRTQLNLPARTRIAVLLAEAVGYLEQNLRNQFRPLIGNVLEQVGLLPQNIPEYVARGKLIEELLDHVVEHGFLNTGKFRDALSQSDLKLQDVAGPRELLEGDRLLRADRGLAQALDGVYRPAAVYIRWTQRISSLAFGTPFGRFLTLYLVLPFGGAYLALAFLIHVYDWIFVGPSNNSPPVSQSNLFTPPAPTAALESATKPDGWGFTLAVLGLGIFVFLMIHQQAFRRLFMATLKSVGAHLYFAFIELPRQLLRIPLVEQILHSPAYATLRSYIIKPGLLSLFLVGLSRFIYPIPGRHWTLDVFLISALFLNSPVGRYADEWLTDIAIRAWDELRVRVIAAVLQWIMDAFHRLLSGLDRLLFTLDEWSRFRIRDNRLMQVFKLVTGSMWSVVSYFIVFAFTLLIEPQVNPIKHFPVVTVSHKLILPMYPILAGQLSPYMGKAWANTLVWCTIWMVPGVFGFLVWELRENWRLYAANRPMALQPQPVGLHGETMSRLVRPGFHAGTIRKLYNRLRRATRRTRKVGDWLPVNREHSGLRTLERAIQRFVERELLELLRKTDWCGSESIAVREVRLATNQVEVALESAIMTSVWRIVWEDHDGQLVGFTYPDAACDSMTDTQRQALHRATAGLFERTGVERVRGSWGSTDGADILWDDWIREWSQDHGQLGTSSSTATRHAYPL